MQRSSSAALPDSLESQSIYGYGVQRRIRRTPYAKRTGAPATPLAPSGRSGAGVPNSVCADTPGEPSFSEVLGGMPRARRAGLRDALRSMSAVSSWCRALQSDAQEEGAPGDPQDAESILRRHYRANLAQIQGAGTLFLAVKVNKSPALLMRGFIFCTDPKGSFRSVQNR
jgi:hypothetical protein